MLGGAGATASVYMRTEGLLSTHYHVQRNWMCPFHLRGTRGQSQHPHLRDKAQRR